MYTYIWYLFSLNTLKTIGNLWNLDPSFNQITTAITPPLTAPAASFWMDIKLIKHQISPRMLWKYSIQTNRCCFQKNKGKIPRYSSDAYIIPAVVNIKNATSWETPGFKSFVRVALGKQFAPPILFKGTRLLQRFGAKSHHSNRTEAGFRQWLSLSWVSLEKFLRAV